MASGVKNMNFRCIIRTKEIVFDNLTHAVFWAKAELVYKNPWKRSVFKSQFQNPPNLGEKIFFKIHAKTTSNSRSNKNRLSTLSHRLLDGGSLEVPEKYYVKIKTIWDYISWLNDVLSHNSNGKTQSLWCLVSII